MKKWVRGARKGIAMFVESMNDDWPRILATNLWPVAGMEASFFIGWNQRHVYQEQGCDPSRPTTWRPGCGHTPPWMPSSSKP